MDSPLPRLQLVNPAPPFPRLPTRTWYFAEDVWTDPLAVYLPGISVVVSALLGDLCDYTVWLFPTTDTLHCN